MHLKILGRASNAALKKYTEILNYDPKNRSEVILFFDFSEYNIPIGQIFSIIENLHHQTMYLGSITLMEVSQEFVLPFDLIPKGYKTISKIRFVDQHLPSVIIDLPQIDDWFETAPSLLLK